MKAFVFLLIALAVIFILYNFKRPETEKVVDKLADQNPTAIFVTSQGELEVELFADKIPKTVDNFIKLAETSFYDGTLFHRVIDGFMIQGGDPNTKGSDTSSYGRGGPGYAIPDEFVAGISNLKGTISMANSGPNTGGSQFFINVADNTFLEGKHAVFGKVLKGMDVAIKISKIKTGPADLPIAPVKVESIRVKMP